MSTGGRLLRERRGRAMGSDVHLLVTGGSAVDPAELDVMLDRAWDRLQALERRWSRFRPDSELSRLNARGHLEGASDDLLLAIGAALDAWRATDARFDPTVLDALEHAGYDRSFDELPGALDLLDPPPGTTAADDRPIAPAPGPVGIVVDTERGRIDLPPGVHVDLGGIGKGLAADVIASELAVDETGTGVDGVLVNLGGDARAIGRPPTGSDWVVAVEHPFDPDEELTRMAFPRGAVATSSVVRRRWRTSGGQEAHHLIDPATGRPVARGLVAVTVLAGEARWAEVLTKAAIVAGRDLGPDLIVDAGAAGIAVTDDGAVLRIGGIEAYEPAG